MIPSESYYDAAHTVARISKQIISNDLRNREDDTHRHNVSLYKNRSGSTIFEEHLKTCIREHHDQIVKKSNEHLEGLGRLVRITRVVAVENENESQNRSFADCLIECTHKGDNISIPVNIKLSNGKTYDNIGGWSSIGRIFFNDDRITTRKGFLAACEAKGPVIGVRDYFLWSFDKTKEDFMQIVSSGKMVSLIAATEGSIKFNGAQSLPLQFNASVAKSMHEWEDFDFYQSRDSFLLKLNTDMVQYNAIQYDDTARAHAAVLRHLGLS